LFNIAVRQWAIFSGNTIKLVLYKERANAEVGASVAARPSP